jgi:dipeptidyl aminopeptidase/acylaminoacyl peptidase
MRKNSLRFALVLAVSLHIISDISVAQKKDLTPEDYAQWQSISQTALSPDGNWFSYGISLTDGDGWLAIREAGADSTEEKRFMNSFNQEFSNDNRWLVFRIGIPQEEARQRRDRNETIRYNLGILDLETGVTDTVNHIVGYEFSDDGRFLRLNKYRPNESTIRGSDVLLRDLHNGTDLLLGNVAESGFNDDGSLFAMLIDSYDQTGNGLQLLDLETMSTTVPVSDAAEYRSLQWNEDGTALAFMKKQELEDHSDHTYQIYAITGIGQNPEINVFNLNERDDFPEDMRIVDYRTLQWSDDGNRLFFGIKEMEAREADQPEENEADDEPETEQDDPDAHLPATNVEVWHWRDDPIQPRQRVMSQAQQRNNFLSVWHLEEDRFVQLMDDYDHTLRLIEQQNHAILYDPAPYKPRFRESWNDVYVVDVATGERTLVLERHETVRNSPGGNYLLYFLDDQWWSYHIRDERHTNLTENIDTRFNNFTFISGRENDNPFGAGQWAENDEWVLLYDQFDVYQAASDGSEIERITNGAPQQIRYRHYRMNFEINAIDPAEPFYLTMYGDRTKDRGFARVNRHNNVQTLIYEPRMINRLSKAEDADIYIYMEQTAVDSPNFYHTNGSFSQRVRLTDTNPQQDEFYWADDELITFTNDRGEELEGRLLYPANYEPGRQYPMMVHIYERRSQTLHYYSMPGRTSAYNQRRFSSEGYFVFEPDITYELRRPGMSAVESVVPAVKKVLETGMVDEEKIGLTGHSWGGYQTNFIITQTDLFASAVAGAPLTNMISMYNSVYWNTGMPDATIFEINQGRFPDPYWQDWDNFIENSPIFQIQNTETPLLLKFGTDDGAVDFNQGVELYNTMRRMEKPFVMLVYDGENHSLGRRENQIDFANRAFEWHDHFIRGKEPADWIIHGLPFIERPGM